MTPARAAGAPPPTLYVASNRPGQIRSLLPLVAAEVAKAVAEEGTRMGVAHIRVMGWHDLLQPPTPPSPGSPSGPGAPGGGGGKGPEAGASTRLSGLSGLATALVEHELCATAPVGFAGSAFSTWANLIGARRVASGRYPRGKAYRELQSGAVLPDCTRRVASRRDAASRREDG